jgi:hypothetical protein
MIGRSFLMMLLAVALFPLLGCAGHHKHKGYYSGPPCCPSPPLPGSAVVPSASLTPEPPEMGYDPAAPLPYKGAHSHGY